MRVQNTTSGLGVISTQPALSRSEREFAVTLPSVYQLPLLVFEKRCTKCGDTKPISAFGKDKRRTDGFFPYCKRCRLVNPALHDERAKHKAQGLRWCNRCEQWLRPDCFGRNKSTPDGINHYCKPCVTRDSLRYYHEDEERTKALNRRRYWKVKDVSKAKYATWYKANRDRVIRRIVERGRTLEGKARQAQANHIRRVRVGRAPATLTAAEWASILEAQEWHCLRCGLPFNDALPPTRDHIIPVVKGGGLTVDNVIALCKPCNSAKRDRPADYPIPARFDGTSRSVCPAMPISGVSLSTIAPLPR